MLLVGKCTLENTSTQSRFIVQDRLQPHDGRASIFTLVFQSFYS